MEQHVCQLVNRQLSPLFHALIRQVGRESGVAAVLNTSFNIAGEPIVLTPYDAIKTFRYANLDALAMEGCLVEVGR